MEDGLDGCVFVNEGDEIVACHCRREQTAVRGKDHLIIQVIMIIERNVLNAQLKEDPGVALRLDHA